jgi:peptidoglycan/LPS O-acetylase OafA/YrhL
LLLLVSWFGRRSRVARRLIYAVAGATLVLEAVAGAVYGSDPLMTGLILVYAAGAALAIAAVDGLGRGTRNRR